MTHFVGSLFSGIGGMDAGLHRAGHEHVFFCESDAYRRDVLAERWPGVPVFDDVAALRVESAPRAKGDGGVTFADGTGRLYTVPVPGLLCGGFPCQDLSVAGQRAGLAGARSGLFFEFARLAESFRPRWLLIENVPGLLSSNGGRDFGVVLGTLADVGYGLAWRVLDSRFFGVPQRRRRVYIVGAVADGDPRAAADRAGEILAVGSRCQRHPATRGEARQNDPRSPVAGTLGGRRGFTGDDIDRGGHTSLSGLGNGGPDDNDAQAGRLIAVPISGDALRAGDAKTPSPDAEGRVRLRDPGLGIGAEGDPAFTVTAGSPGAVAAPLTSGGHPNSNAPGRRKEDDENLVIAGPLSGGNDGIGRRTEDDPNLVAYPLARRGRAQGSELEVGEAEVYNALRAGDGGSSRLNQVMVGLSVRRLTPIECERLQGLGDGWTDLGDTPDSKRYSALGDAVTATVSDWIGQRLVTEIVR